MPTYISLVDWTGEGIENVKESPNRLQQAREMFTSHASSS
jgi:uncharacterized protein with GYD domain